jgi:hypothetical protein
LNDRQRRDWRRQGHGPPLRDCLLGTTDHLIAVDLKAPRIGGTIGVAGDVNDPGAVAELVHRVRELDRSGDRPVLRAAPRRWRTPDECSRMLALTAARSERLVGEVAANALADLAGADQAVERLEAFLHRREMIGLVLLVEVDPVRSEPPQAGLDGGHDARGADADREFIARPTDGHARSPMYAKAF